MAVSASLAAQMLQSPIAHWVIAEWEQEPGPAEGRMMVAPIHLHRECDEAWIVLSGRLGFLIGDQEVEVSAGGAVLVPRGTKHTYWNPDPVEPAKYILIMTTKTAALIEAIHAMQDRSWPALEALFESHDAELVGW